MKIKVRGNKTSICQCFVIEFLQQKTDGLGRNSNAAAVDYSNFRSAKLHKSTRSNWLLVRCGGKSLDKSLGDLQIFLFLPHTRDFIISCRTWQDFSLWPSFWPPIKETMRQILRNYSVRSSKKRSVSGGSSPFHRLLTQTAGNSEIPVPVITCGI